MLRAERQEIYFRHRQGLFSSPPHPARLWTQPASYPMGPTCSLPGGKATEA